MDKRELNISLALTLTAAAVALFFDFRISTGLLLGFGFSCLHILLLTISIDGMLGRRQVNTAVSILAFVFRYVVIAVPLIIALLFDQWFNVYGAAAGFLIYKAVMIGFAVVNKEKE